MNKSIQFKFIAPYYRISFISVYIYVCIYVHTSIYTYTTMNLHRCANAHALIHKHPHTLFAYAVKEEQNVWFLPKDLVRIINIARNEQ